MILTVPFNHPYFLNFMKQENKDIPDLAQSAEALAFLFMKNNQVVAGCATLIHDKNIPFSASIGHCFSTESDTDSSIEWHLIKGIIHHAYGKYDNLYLDFTDEQEQKKVSFYQVNWKIVPIDDGGVQSDMFRLNINDNWKNHPVMTMNLNQYFLYLCRDNNTQVIDEFLSYPGVDIHYQDAYHNNGLMVAAQHECLDTIKYLYDKGLNILSQNLSGMNVLLLACENGHFDAVKYLLTSSEIKKHPSVYHQDNSGWNALMYACKKGHLGIMKYLLTSNELKKHADIHHRNNFRENVLMIACSMNNLVMVDYLLSAHELKEKANFDNPKDVLKILQCICQNYFHEMTHKLIIDYDMPIDSEAMAWLAKENQIQVLELINTRELYKKIEQNTKSASMAKKRKI